MNDCALIRARAGDDQAFAALTDPYRRELQLHCYRILGQVQDAEDAVQETLLSAWKALESFEERSTLRSWLYRIATNRCLNMLRDSGRRPAVAAGPASTPPEPTRYGEVPWLEPYPDVLLEGIVDGTAGPEARYETREAVTLAFLTALHRLPPRQRAVLVLRDVLGFSAIEVAAMLDTTPTSVNSALIRARATIEERGPQPRDRAPLPRSAQEHELVARFADAFERGDVEPIVALPAEGAWWTMPPEPYGYQGHDAIKQFIADTFARRGQPPPPHSDAGQLTTRVRPLRQRPTHRRRPRALAARADTRRRPHLAHHPLRLDRRPTALRTAPNDSVVATRSALATRSVTRSANDRFRHPSVVEADQRYGDLPIAPVSSIGVAADDCLRPDPSVRCARLLELRMAKMHMQLVDLGASPREPRIRRRPRLAHHELRRLEGRVGRTGDEPSGAGLACRVPIEPVRDSCPLAAPSTDNAVGSWMQKSW